MATQLGVGLIGCGAIGSLIAQAVDNGKVGDIQLIVVYDMIQEKAEKLSASLTSKPKVVKSLEEMLSIPAVQLILEAGSQSVLRESAVKVLQSGKDLMAMSIGAFVDPQLLMKFMQPSSRLAGNYFVLLAQ